MKDFPLGFLISLIAIFCFMALGFMTLGYEFGFCEGQKAALNGKQSYHLVTNVTVELNK